MYVVSEEYREQMNRPVRNPSYVRLTFGITNPNAPGLSTITSNGAESFSNLASLDRGLNVYRPVATLEPHRWLLNGQQSIYDPDNPTYQGFVGNRFSTASGTYSPIPALTITFSDYVAFAGLSFRFDSGGNDWHPTRFQIRAYHGSTSVYNKVKYPTNEYFVVDDKIPACNKLVLYWRYSNKPYARPRLMSLIYGIMQELTSDDLVSVSCAREVDPISTSFPKADLKFSIFDVNGKYDPDNPNGVWEYLETRQPVTAEIGYELDGGGVEWMPWANCYTTGDVNVSGQGASLQVEISAASLVNHLTMQYDEGKYYPSGRSLFDLANDVMTFAGFSGGIRLDESLKNIITYQPLPIDSVNNLLQLIANAGRCILDVDRGGEVSIRPQNNTLEDFQYNFSNLITEPSTTKIPPLKRLGITYYSVVLDTTTSVVVDKAAVNNATRNTITLNHDAISGGTVTVSGLTLHSYTSYAYKTVVNVSGTGTVTVKGYRINSNELLLVKRYGDVGEDLDSLGNRLLTSFEMANAYADWIAAYEKRRNTYSASDRGYPEVDVGDNVGFVTGYENNINVTQVAQTITYNGTITGEGKYLICSQ